MCIFVCKLHLHFPDSKRLRGFVCHEIFGHFFRHSEIFGLHPPPTIDASYGPDYALRIEFQMRGSPHLHALIWTSDCPELTNDTKNAYIDYIDRHVQAYLPDKETDPELYDLRKTYQTHNHSKTCRKYKSVTCRFNFGQFFTDRTIVAEPLAEVWTMRLNPIF
jgi:hypothetical protein